MSLAQHAMRGLCDAVGGAPPAPLMHLAMDTFLASGTWTCPITGTARVQCWGAGGGGQTAVGGGGGGAYAETPDVAVSPGNYTITVGAGAVNTNGGDSSFGSTVIAKGGLSRGNGGTGGTASASTGTIKYDGGEGTASGAAGVGGGSAGSLGATTDTSAGAPDGAGGGIGGALTTQLGGGGGNSGAAGRAGSRGEVRISYDVEATVGYPRCRGRSEGRDASATTSRSAVLPSGIVAGELLLLWLVIDAAATYTATGWTEVLNAAQGSDVRGVLLRKTAAGSDTLTIDTGSSVVVHQQSWRFANAGTPTGTTAAASSTNADPPEHTPAGGSAKYYWLVLAGWDGNSATFNTLNTWPADTGARRIVPRREQTLAVTSAACERLLEASAFNPSAWTSDSEQWVAATVAIPYA